MNFSRFLVAIISIFVLSIAASGCIYSPSQDSTASKQMQAQDQSSTGADLAASEQEKEEEARITKAAVARRHVDLKVKNPIVLKGVREVQPISTGGISIVAYPDPVVTAVDTGESYWQQFTASASGVPGMYFSWTVTGLPESWNYSISGSYQQNLLIDETATVAGSFPITVKAAQMADSTNFEEYPFTLVVSGPGRDDDDDDEDVAGDCSTPLGLALVKNINSKGAELETDQPSTVILGGEGHELRYSITGGKGPFTAIWWSKVARSRQCWLAVQTEADPMPYYFPADDKKCVDGTEPKWAQNMTWQLQGDGPWGVIERNELDLDDSDPRVFSAATDSRSLKFKGDIRYLEKGQNALPLSIISSSWYDIDTNPVDTFRVRVLDSCGNSVTLPHDFNIAYDNEPLEDAEVTLYYKNPRTSNEDTWRGKPSVCKDELCDDFRKAFIAFFFYGKAPPADFPLLYQDVWGLYIKSDDYGHEAETFETVPYEQGDRHLYALDEMFELANGFALFPMQYLEDHCNPVGEPMALPFDCKAKVQKDVHQIKNATFVKDALYLVLTIDAPDEVGYDGGTWYDDENNYDNLDILGIRIETRQWRRAFDGNVDWFTGEDHEICGQDRLLERSTDNYSHTFFHRKEVVNY